MRDREACQRSIEGAVEEGQGEHVPDHRQARRTSGTGQHLRRDVEGQRCGTDGAEGPGQGAGAGADIQHQMPGKLSGQRLDDHPGQLVVEAGRSAVPG